MAALTRLVPVTQVVFGSDYPYRRADEHVAGLAQIFNDDERRAIDYGNAHRMRPQLAQIHSRRFRSRAAEPAGGRGQSARGLGRLLIACLPL